MDPAATLSVQGYQVGVTANGENISLEYDAYGGYVDFAGENSVGYIALSGVSNEEYFVDIHDNARAFLMGENYAAFAHEGAIVDVGGFALTCRAVEVCGPKSVDQDPRLTADKSGSFLYRSI
jgi:hypothetical protein